MAKEEKELTPAQKRKAAAAKKREDAKKKKAAAAAKLAEEQAKQAEETTDESQSGETVSPPAEEDPAPSEPVVDGPTDDEGTEGAQGEAGDTDSGDADDIDPEQEPEQDPAPESEDTPDAPEIVIAGGESQEDDTDTDTDGDTDSDDESDDPEVVEVKGKTLASRIIYSTLTEYAEYADRQSGQPMQEVMKRQVLLYHALRDVFLLDSDEVIVVVKDIVEFFRENSEGVCSTTLMYRNMDNIKLTNNEIKLFNSLLHLFHTAGKIGILNVTKKNKIDIPLLCEMFKDKKNGAQAAAVLQGIFSGE